MERAQIVHLRRNTKKEQEMVGCLPHENREPCSHACIMLSPCTIRITISIIAMAMAFDLVPCQVRLWWSPSICFWNDPSFLPSFLPPSLLHFHSKVQWVFFSLGVMWWSEANWIALRRFASRTHIRTHICDDQKQIELRRSGLYVVYVYVYAYTYTYTTYKYPHPSVCICMSTYVMWLYLYVYVCGGICVVIWWPSTSPISVEYISIYACVYVCYALKRILIV